MNLLIYLGVWILLLTVLLMEVACGAKCYADILKSLERPEKLIFDVTQPLNDALEVYDPEYIYMDDLNKTNVRLLPTLYYRRDGYYLNFTDFIEDVYQEAPVELPEAMLISPTTFTFLFKPNYIHDNSTLPLTPEAIALYAESKNPKDSFTFTFRAVRGMGFVSAEVKRMKNITTVLKSQLTNIRIGLELDIADDDSDNDIIYRTNLVPVMNELDVLILNIDISLSQFILSYSEFKANLRMRLNPVYEFVVGQSPNLTVYLKLNFLQDDILNGTILPTSDLYQMYYFYLLQFSVYWVNEEGNERLILPTFNNSLGHHRGFDGVALSNLLTIPIEASMMKYGACQVKAMMDLVFPDFTSITLQSTGMDEFLNFDKCIFTNGDECLPNTTESEVCNRPSIHSIIPKINLLYEPIPIIDQAIVNMTVVVKELKDITSGLEGLPWTLIEMNMYWMVMASDINDTTFQNVQTALEQVPRQVGIACSAYNSWTMIGTNDMYIVNSYDYFIDEVYEENSFLREHSNTSVWNVKMFDDDDGSLLAPNVTLSKLLEIAENRTQSLENDPGKGIKLRVFLDQLPFSQPYRMTDGLYCDAKQEAVASRAEMVINFARLYNIPLAVVPTFAFKDTYGYGGWRAVTTVDELDVAETNYPVFVFRHFPDKFLFGGFPTDSCLTWTKDVPKDGALFLSDYAGTTLYISKIKTPNKPVTPKELEVLLLFAFHKFSLAEIAPENIHDLETTTQVLLGQELALKLKQNKTIELYLSVDCNFFDNPHQGLEKLFGNLRKALVKPRGVHLVNCDNSTLPIYNEHFSEKLNPFGILIGLSIENCLDEVNNRFGNLKGLKFFSTFNYVLCNFKYRKTATNTEPMEVAKYLDTTLYIQKYFNRMFPNSSKQIFFRMNTVPNNDSPGMRRVVLNKQVIILFRNEISDFLTYFSDTSQYAMLYKMKFFMFPAFDNELGSKFGWWRIADFRSLANTSVFFEKEAEYLGAETWRPSMENGFSTTGFIIAIVGLCVFFIVVISIILSIFIWFRRQFAFLSKKEVDSFLYGNISIGENRDTAYENLKFPREYEISKRRFVLLSLIGKGNFGLVYYTTLSSGTGDGNAGSITVAVKIPHPDCSRDSFKSILSELKLLSYVGCHPHVLQFIGAHVKEIGRGIAYIATELCENGALQDYLRKMQSKLSELAEQTKDGIQLIERKPNLYELCRFAHEVALGMEYIGSKKIVHGDLSTRNVLLNSNLTCKIGDFGLSKRLYEMHEYVKKKEGPVALPWRWLSIESLKRLEFTVKSDVWSYGVTLWEIFSLGSVPYQGMFWADDFLEKLENGFRMTSPAFSTDDINGKISQCWESYPELRPTFTELTQFFANTRNMEYTTI